MFRDSSPVYDSVPLHNFFRNFLAKSFVDSIIIVTFAVEFERTEKNGRDEDSN